MTLKMNVMMRLYVDEYDTDHSIKKDDHDDNNEDDDDNNVNMIMMDIKGNTITAMAVLKDVPIT